MWIDAGSRSANPRPPIGPARSRSGPVDTSEYLGLFLVEGRRSLAALADSLVHLRRGAARAGAVSEMLRTAHSLKGMSATMGFDEVAEAAHRLEDVLAAMWATDPLGDADLTSELEAGVASLTAVMHAIAVRAELDLGVAEIAATLAPPPARTGAVGGAFEIFPEAVAELATALGKHIDVEIRGAEVLLDPATVAGLRAPLAHIVRNACDHGLEAPAARIAAGKGPVGTVRLAATQTPTEVVVEVADDGRGVDTRALRARAVRAGHLDADAARALPQQRALALAFLPGVSTASTTTEVSGRGIGMDVVRAAISDLGGEVTITTRRGEGTLVRIRLPRPRPAESPAEGRAP